MRKWHSIKWNQFCALTRAPWEARTSASLRAAASGSGRRARRAPRDRPRPERERARRGVRTAPRKVASRSRTPSRGTTVTFQRSTKGHWKPFGGGSWSEESSTMAEATFLTWTGRKMATDHTGTEKDNGELGMRQSWPFENLWIKFVSKSLEVLFYN